MARHKADVVRWFESLSGVLQRQAALCVEDAVAAQRLKDMHEVYRTRGRGYFHGVRSRAHGSKAGEAVQEAKVIMERAGAAPIPRFTPHREREPGVEQASTRTREPDFDYRRASGVDHLARPEQRLADADKDLEDALRLADAAQSRPLALFESGPWPLASAPDSPN